MGVNEIQSREERKNNIVHFPIVWYNALYWAGREPVRADVFSVRVIPYGFRASLTRRLVLRTEAPRAGQFYAGRLHLLWVRCGRLVHSLNPGDSDGCVFPFFRRGRAGKRRERPPLFWCARSAVLCLSLVNKVPCGRKIENQMNQRSVNRFHG